MAVHIEWIMKLAGLEGVGADGRPVPSALAEIAHVDTMVGLDLAVGAAAVEVPAGAFAAFLETTDGVAFRYAFGDADTVTVAGSNALRIPASVRLAVGVTPGRWFKSAADT